MKPILKKFLAGTLTASLSMGIFMVAGASGTESQVEAMYFDGDISERDILNTGWTKSSNYEYTMTGQPLKIGTLSGANSTFTVKLPYLPKYYDNEIQYWGGTKLSTAITSASINDNTLYAFTSLSLGSAIGEHEIVLSGTYPVKDLATGISTNKTFTYKIPISIYNETATNENATALGWVTNDNGWSYTQVAKPVVVGSGYQGLGMTVALPAISKNPPVYFTENDLVLDEVSKVLVTNFSVNNSTLYLYFNQNIGNLPGSTGRITLTKEYNGAVYAYTIPVSVSNLSEAKVNGVAAGGYVNIEVGSTVPLSVSNAGTYTDTKVIWCQNINGSPLAETKDYPQLSPGGTIDCRNLTLGTYYFYFETGQGIRSGMFTLNVGTGVLSPGMEADAKTITRLYNPLTGEHLYSSDQYEVRVLMGKGWQNEGSPGKGGGDVPVFRLYNKVTGEHLYSADVNECKTLTKQRNWRYDSQTPVFYAFSSGRYPMYRLTNGRVAAIASHHYSSDASECRVLTTMKGWIFDNGAKPCFYLN